MVKTKKSSVKEQKAIEEKVGFLKIYLEGKLSLQDLADLNIKRRLSWIRKNKKIINKYKDLSLLETAHKVLYLEHMKINPEYSIVKKLSPKKLRIKSYNFCPYLEACKLLNLDTRIICKEFGEPSINLFVKEIHPSLKFSRTYKDKIRPCCDYCEEFIELID
ncbi:MAG: hypothetical protein M1355_00380 [Patescibacteria group bacterium]|nr:hypothetical protein [Patescibacteria group bacterium]